ncbi:D-alanyl-D-alanine carboxypeptidase family protein [Brevibacillus ginsengisoli]|uniref:D-alanyl-D-alanine carboxypeptidase family protein n=1 Tax=Brevibacillus ginsengisoli TaxID=363854 RepID=UPI003CF22BAD
MRYLLICFLVLSSLLLPFSSQPVEAANQTLSADMINAESAVLIDATTGTVLFEKNPDMRQFPASTTKIATGIYTIEYGHLDDLVTVSHKARTVEGTRVYLGEGEQVQLHKLLYGLLMNSGNDAAIAIAEHMAGSTDEFANRVNQFLKDRLNLKNTHFTNPHGLHDPNHYTTASDMAKIAQYAMFNPVFREIVATKKLPWDGKEWKTVLVNHNQMLWSYEGTTGIKNGFTDQAKHALVESAKRGNSEFIAVVMKGDSRNLNYRDVTKMLDYAFANYETVQVAKAGDKFKPTVQETTSNQTPRVDYYFTDKPLYVTVHKGSQMIKEVSANGHLTVLEDSGSNSSQVFSLKPKELPQVASAHFENLLGKATEDSIPRYAILATWFIVNLLMLYYVITRRGRNSIDQRRNIKRYDSSETPDADYQ